MSLSENGDYTFSVENLEVLYAKLDLSSPTGIGYVLVTEKQKGNTALSVTDNLTHETVKLKIEVDKSNHPALTKDTLMFLINDEERIVNL
ncbi:hypothetical protein [uncultured Proteiniphilum sp.]|uniref:hypothetical protein n=1 Tax=uncultured Proteiniphilum sp. TaxID=497637 RepID=UPI0026396830|nr:hypothetical protein [uncultured Proteiniphilum sp.]